MSAWCAYLVIAATAASAGYLLRSREDVAAANSRTRDSSAADATLITPEDLSRTALVETKALDIAAANLAAAQGLPGADRLDVRDALRRVDEWANRVRGETDRHLYKFRASPAEYKNSEPYFRALMLITVLQQDCGMHYSPARALQPDCVDSRDLFLHGVMSPDHGGTCASMPVLYIAVGRRLGYPLKLVAAKSHLFARWDDGVERFNIEGTNQGLNTFDDDYYRCWPERIDEAEAAWYLKSMTPTEEIAYFLALRGDCLAANGQYAEAEVAYADAHRLAPEYPPYLAAPGASRGRRTPRGRVGLSRATDAERAGARRAALKQAMSQTGETWTHRPAIPPTTFIPKVRESSAPTCAASATTC